MQIAVKVETGFNCNWRNIEPLQPEGFKGQTENEKETLKNSIVKNGFHDAFDVWKHDNKLLSIDGVHRKIALLELAAEGYEIPEQLPCAYIDAKDEEEIGLKQGINGQRADLWEKCKQGNSFATVSNGNNFSSIRLSDNEVCNTITANQCEGFFHSTEKGKISDNECKIIGTYPMDYNFNGLRPMYLIGMSVPPVMTAQIAHRFAAWRSF